jgi:hypothetical protein
LKLQRVQNSAARLVYGVKDVDSITAVLKSLHWLPIESRIVFKIAMLTYHSLNGSGPVYLSSLLRRLCSPYAPRPTEAFYLFLPRTRLKTFGDRAFTSSDPRIRNSLPLSVKSCDSLSSFHSSLKTYLFKNSPMYVCWSWYIYLYFKSPPSWVKAPLITCVKGAIQINYIIIIIIIYAGHALLFSPIRKNKSVWNEVNLCLYILPETFNVDKWRHFFCGRYRKMLMTT